MSVGPAWDAAIDGYQTYLIAQGQRPATVKLRREQLRLIGRGVGCAPAELTADVIVAWFGAQTRWKAATRHSHRAALNGFLSWSYRTGVVPVYLGDALPRVRQPKSAPRPASDDAWNRALDAAVDAHDWRVMIAIRLAGEAGLRRAEVAAVHAHDLIDGADGAQLIVHGKGGKIRVVPVSDDLVELFGNVSGFLFPGRTDGHISAAHLGELVSAVLPDGYTMHTLRHRFATRAYRGTRNLRAVQVLLGHESVATTERYTAVDDGELRAAMTAAADVERRHRRR